MQAKPLDTIENQPIQERVLQRIRDGIIQGTLPPGSPLRIDRLAAELGVSHMPVREALHVLTVEGLAVRLPRRGVRVSTLNIDDLKSAYEAIAAIEGLAGRIAAQNLPDSAVRELRVILAPAPALAAAHDTDGLLRVNREFHARIYDHCQNRWVCEFCRQLWNYIYRLRRTYPQSARRQQQAVTEHQEILEALAHHDGDRTEALIRRHCAGSRDELLDQLVAANVPGFQSEGVAPSMTTSKKRGRPATNTV